MYERTVKRGEIYFVLPSTYDGSEQSSGRPAIIVSNDLNNLHSSVVEVVYLTTKEKKSLPTHVKICSTYKESTALCEQITSVSVERLGDYVCTCSDDEMSLIDTALEVSIGIVRTEKDEVGASGQVDENKSME